MKRFWGDNYYDHESKQWLNENRGGKLKRGFVEFILEPIHRLFTTVRNDDLASTENVAGRLGLSLTNEEKTLKSKDLIKISCYYLSHDPSP